VSGNTLKDQTVRHGLRGQHDSLLLSAMRGFLWVGGGGVRGWGELEVGDTDGHCLVFSFSSVGRLVRLRAQTRSPALRCF